MVFNERQPNLSIDKFLTEAFLLAIITGACYLAAFVYQYNYLSYFGVPVYFVDVNISLVLTVVAPGIFWLLLFAVVLYFYTKMHSSCPQKRFSNLGWYITNIIIVSPLLYFSSALQGRLLFIFALVFQLLIFELFKYLYKRSNLVSNIVEDSKASFFYIINDFGKHISMLLLVLIMFVFMTTLLGTIIAGNKSEFLVSNTQPGYVIISNYHDGFIVATIDSRLGKSDGGISFISKDTISENGIKFTKKTIEQFVPKGLRGK
jgi:hypothetical protein